MKKLNNWIVKNNKFKVIIITWIPFAFYHLIFDPYSMKAMVGFVWWRHFYAASFSLVVVVHAVIIAVILKLFKLNFMKCYFYSFIIMSFIWIINRLPYN